MIKLIIFDWDDVIIQGAKEGYYNCYRDTLHELGVHLSEKELDIRIKSKWGQPFREELRELLKERPDLLEKACEIYGELKFGGETFVNQLHEVPGVNELLFRLSQKYKLAVATGNQKKMLESRIMPMFNIPNVFCQMVTSDENLPPGKGKPDPYMLNLILTQQKIKNSEALYVGDAKSDVMMAKSAGVEPVVVLTGHLTQKDAEALSVKHILPDVTHLEEVFESYTINLPKYG